MLPFFFPSDKGEFHYIKNSQSPLCNITYSFVRVALVTEREVVDWVAGVVILDKGTGRHTIPDARKPGAIGNYQICSDEEGVLITV